MSQDGALFAAAMGLTPRPTDNKHRITYPIALLVRPAGQGEVYHLISIDLSAFMPL